MEEIETLIADAHAAYRALDADQRYIDRVVANVGWACYRDEYVTVWGGTLWRPLGLGMQMILKSSTRTGFWGR